MRTAFVFICDGLPTLRTKELTTFSTKTIVCGDRLTASRTEQAFVDRRAY
jgi:hypothetical protein